MANSTKAKASDEIVRWVKLRIEAWSFVSKVSALEKPAMLLEVGRKKNATVRHRRITERRRRNSLINGTKMGLPGEDYLVLETVMRGTLAKNEENEAVCW